MRQWQKFDPILEPLVISRAALSLYPDKDEAIDALHAFFDEVKLRFATDEDNDIAYWRFQYADGSVAVAVTWAEE